MREHECRRLQLPGRVWQARMKFFLLLRVGFQARADQWPHLDVLPGAIPFLSLGAADP
jgi:hypothetical protein